MADFYSARDSKGYRLRLNVWESDVSSTNNTSKVGYTIILERNGAYSFSTSGNKIICSINGVQVVNKTLSINMVSATSVTLATGYTNAITHNSDGTKVVACTSTYTPSGKVTYEPTKKTASGNFTLTTIARASQPTIAPNPFNIGEPVLITTNRKSTSFTDDLFITIGNNTTNIAQDVTSSVSLDTSSIANQIYALIPNTTSYTNNIINNTYNGTTLIGSNSTPYTAYVTNAEPTFNVAYKDTNASTIAITGNNQKIIRNQSTLQINITNATALYGASLVSASVNINGNIYTGSFSGSTLNINVGTVDLSSNENATITVTDTRGLSTTKTLEITMLNWELPSAIITCQRQNNYYTETDVMVDADYSSLDGNNTISITFKYKKTTDVSYTTTTLTDNVQTQINMDNLYDWDIQVIVTDLFGSTTYNLTLSKGVPLIFFDRKRESVSIGCFPQRDDTLEVYGVDLLQDKQDTLISGTNIKTINNNSILGSGNINISGGGGSSTDVQINATSITSGGTADIKVDGTYNSSTNKIATMSSLTSYSKTTDIQNNKNLTKGIEYIVGTQASDTNAWTGTSTDTGCSSGNLYTGKTIIYHLPVAGTSSAATLNLTLPDGSTTGAKNIYRQASTTVTTTFAAGCDILMVYDGTHWKVNAYVDTNTNTIAYQVRTNSSIYANKTGYSSNRYTLLFEVDGGLSGAARTIATGTTKTTVAFKYIPHGVIKYYSTSGAISNGSNFAASGLWDQYTLNLAYTFNTGSTLTSGKPVYMRCVVNSDGTLTPNYSGSPSHPIVQTLPNTADGYVYVYLGQAYSTTNIELTINHPIYEYKDGKIREWQYDSGGKTLIVNSTNSISITDLTTGSYVCDYLGTIDITVYTTSSTATITVATFSSIDVEKVSNSTYTLWNYKIYDLQSNKVYIGNITYVSAYSSYSGTYKDVS